MAGFSKCAMAAQSCAMFLLLPPLLLPSRAAAAQAQQEKDTIVVTDLRPVGVEKNTATIVSEHLRTSVSNLGLFTLANREEMDKVIAEQKFQLEKCDETKCYIEVGQAMGARMMVAGTIGKIENVFSVTLILLDITLMTEKNRVSRDCKCGPSDLKGFIDSLVAELFGVSAGLEIGAGPSEGDVFFDVKPSDANYDIDAGKVKGQLRPGQVNIVTLPAGPHAIEVSKAGYETVRRNISLEIRKGGEHQGNSS